MSAQTSDVSSRASIIGSYLDTINASCLPALDALDSSVYESLKNETSLPETAVLRLINGLEIEEFIPAKTAILLKLSWGQDSTVQAILNNIIAYLYDKGIISQDFKQCLFSLVDSGKKIEVLQLIYACMRFEEGKDVYCLDDLSRLGPAKLLEFIQTKELVSCRNFLQCKINRYSNGEIDEAQTEILSQMLRAMRIDNPSLFKTLYISYLTKKINTIEESIEKYVFEEIVESVTKTEPEHLFSTLYRILKTHDFYSKQLVQVVELTHLIQQIPPSEKKPLFARCDSAFKNTLHLLADYKNMSQGSKTLYCLQHGLIRSEWKKIGSLFEKEKHKFCDCHSTKPREGFFPLHQSPFACTDPSHEPVQGSETVAIFGCNWGNGHKSAAMNTAEILEEKGMHPVTIDIPADLLAEDCSPNSKEVKPKTEQILNFLVRRKAYALINVLRSCSGLNSVQPPPSQEHVRKALQRMLLINPSYAIATIVSISEPVTKAAEIMGIPVAHIITDVDRSILTRNAPRSYRHFKSMISYPEEMMHPTVSLTETPEQIAVVGPPVKKIYDTIRSNDDVNRLRTELQEELGMQIPSDKKLVIISSGGIGAFSPYPKLLTEKYGGKTKEEIPFVAVVLCGKDNEHFLRHVTSVSAHLPPGVIVPKEYVAPATMEKLFRVASRGGGLIGKAGGMTIFELSKIGTRILIDKMPVKMATSGGFIGNLMSLINWILHKIFRFSNELPWEKVNENFALNQGFARNVSSKEEFYREFDQMLSQTEPVELSFEVDKFSQRLPAVLNDMNEAVQNDDGLRHRRRFIENPQNTALIV